MMDTEIPEEIAWKVDQDAFENNNHLLQWLDMLVKRTMLMLVGERH